MGVLAALASAGRPDAAGCVAAHIGAVLRLVREHAYPGGYCAGGHAGRGAMGSWYVCLSVCLFISLCRGKVCRWEEGIANLGTVA